MASLGDLTTDSLPDPPRDEIPRDDSRVKSSEDENCGKQNSAKGHQERRKSSPSQEKRRSSNTKSPPNFTIPGINTPAGSGSMICINNASNVHVGNSFNINIVGQAFSQPHSSKSPSPEPQSMEKSKTVKDACKSRTVVTNNDIDTVSEHVGKRWKKLGKQLGFSEEQMERFQEDNREMGLKEVVYQMLLDWKQDKGPEAHVGFLCHCLWSSRLYKAAELLAAQHSGKSL